MHRRGFLASLAALAVAPLVPTMRTPAVVARSSGDQTVVITLAESFEVDFGWESWERALRDAEFDVTRSEFRLKGRA